ncbi:hypothetical protein E5D57_000659 [Metarhizium anisopliae]|nr:hypothetical protein E5D57_000659 [Metarhizium anisopliae]
MPGPKMNVLAGLVAALGVFVTGAVAESGVANGQVTKTLEPKPIGTATENASAPASAGAESTEAAMPAETEPPNQPTIEMTNSSGTVTRPSSTGAPAITSSALAAAAADIKALPSVAWGALILAMAMVL